MAEEQRGGNIDGQFVLLKEDYRWRCQDEKTAHGDG